MDSPFIAESLGHLQHTSLGGCISRDVCHCDKRREGCDVDDLARPAQLDQVHTELLSRDIRCLEIDGEDLEPLRQPPVISSQVPTGPFHEDFCNGIAPTKRTKSIFSSVISSMGPLRFRPAQFSSMSGTTPVRHILSNVSLRLCESLMSHSNPTTLRLPPTTLLRIVSSSLG